MKEFIDLSYTIEHEMPVHQFDDGVKFYQDKFLERHKYNNSRLEMGMHAGTHVDAPKHLLDQGKMIDEYSLDNFYGNGCLLDVRGEGNIRMKEEYRNCVKKGDIVLIYTGFDTKYGSETYYNEHPIIDKTLAQFLVEKQVKMVEMDLPSPDRYPFEIHKTFFCADILIIENMKNLEKLIGKSEFHVIAFSIKVMAEASLVRVVASL